VCGSDAKGGSLRRISVHASWRRSELERMEGRPDRKFQTRHSESPLILVAHMVLVPACTPAFGPKLTAIFHHRLRAGLLTGRARVIERKEGNK
jgi:hypothetical protein